MLRALVTNCSSLWQLLYVDLKVAHVIRINLFTCNQNNLFKDEFSSHGLFPFLFKLRFGEVLCHGNNQTENPAGCGAARQLNHPLTSTGRRKPHPRSISLSFLRLKHFTMAGSDFRSSVFLCCSYFLSR